jgi:hypothetical protein
MTVSIHPRNPGHTCARCLRKLARGDRVLIVHIVEKVGTNPDNPNQVGSWLTGDFELVHLDCKNPTLDHMIIVT